MKIVIDIPEDLYEGIERRDGALETEYVCDELMKSVDKGTPLPKGHGRIIDESQIRGTFTWDNLFIECFAPTIIEAESEDKE